MERLKHIKEMLIAQVEGQLGRLQDVDAEELGEVVDMVKDLEEAIYYCTITKAMEGQDQRYPYERDMDRDRGRMYYTEATGQGGSTSAWGNETGRGMTGGGNHPITPAEQALYYPEHSLTGLGMRDEREGRSPASRKMYMESKELHRGKEHQMKELENYMQELTEDMVEMIRDASPEEKQLLQKKIAALASKIS